MKQATWSIGDHCYIADVRTTPGFVRCRVMPARVIHVAGIARVIASAMSLNPVVQTTVHPCLYSIEGNPHPTRWSALCAAWSQMRQMKISIFTPIVYEGTAPDLPNVPVDMPALGQIVYWIDAQHREILEARVGYLRYELGKLVLAVDESPSNLESSMLHIERWWTSREAVTVQAKCEHTDFDEWKFVSQQELASRVDAQIDQAWADARRRLKEPGFFASSRASA